MKKLLSFSFLVFTFRLLAQPNCGAPSTGLIPINDLGIGISPITGMQGGLYPNGSNEIPDLHKRSGLQLAKEIQCLDGNGNPNSASGKIVWLSIGMSNCTQETQQFIPMANSYVGKNPNLVLVDGAQGGQTAYIISNPAHPNYSTFWNTVNTRLRNAGVSSEQVQVIWLKEANQVGNFTTKPYYDSLVIQFKRICNDLKLKFPNVKICYLASRISARYATTNLNPEPHSYWTGWAIKKVIEDQINGDSQLQFQGQNAKSPWLSWGIYMWSDGEIPQASNPDIFLNCATDFQNDGTHPSTLGAKKVAKWLLDFFTKDSTAIPWFVNKGCQLTQTNDENIMDSEFSCIPNPTNGHIRISGNSPISDVIIFNSIGQKISAKISQGDIDLSLQSDGLYYLHCRSLHKKLVFKIFKSDY